MFILFDTNSDLFVVISLTYGILEINEIKKIIYFTSRVVLTFQIGCVIVTLSNKSGGDLIGTIIPLSSTTVLGVYKNY